MGFDLAHIISSISKLVLRTARNSDVGGSKDDHFEIIGDELNTNDVSIEENGFYNWLENALKKLPSNIEAINFNLYEDNDNKWSIELVGTSTFDENNSDWACNEVYTTREKPYILAKKGNWKTIENLFTSFLLNYLERGKYAHILKECRGIGIGFVDGDVSIIYKK